ncbi:MAG: hypothetical protein HY079_10775, partial [Elusimicrobia bacterium]|nr:hypothetical protein [Elusimicrobiota bacterium]
MTAELLRLEFRRNRLSALSAALAFLATLPVCRLVSSTTGLEPRLAVEAALTAWMLVGAPLAAVLIGAASGAASASAEAVDAEAPLPLSAERRAAASMAAAFLLTAAFAAFLLAASSLLGVAVERVLSTHEKNWGRSFWFSLEVSPLLAAACLDALAGA